MERNALNSSRRFSKTAGRDAALTDTLTTWTNATVLLVRSYRVLGDRTTLATVAWKRTLA